MNKGRIEALTDGILAIAATIMVLELHVPGEPTFQALMAEGATFLAYIISFFMIYVMWHSHHDAFRKAEKVSPRAFLLNGVWVLFITLIPFATAWVGGTVMHPLPEFLDGLDMLLCRASFDMLYRQLQRDNPGSLNNGWENRRFSVMTYILQAACLALTFVFPPIALIFAAVTTVFSVVYILKPTGKEESI